MGKALSGDLCCIPTGLVNLTNLIWYSIDSGCMSVVVKGVDIPCH